VGKDQVVRIRRRLAVAVTLAALAVPVLAAAPQAAEPGVQFAGTSAAQLAQVVTDSQPSATAPIDRPGVAVVGAADTGFDPFGAITSAAALYDPGATVAGGPGLLCEQFLPCPTQPPAYPLSVSASYPTRPEAHTAGDGERLGGGDAPLALTPAGAGATASADAVAGEARLSELAVLPAVGLVTVAQGVSRSEQRAERGALLVRARSRLTDIDIAGVLQVESLQVQSALALSAAGGEPERSSTVVVQGASVAGQSVRIDETGIHALGRDDGGRVRDQLDEALRTLLTDRGVDVRLVAAPEQPADGPPQAAAYGLLVTFTRAVSDAPDPPPLPAPGLPGVPSANRTYTGSVLLGAASSTAFAVEPLALSLPELPAPPAASSPDAAALPLTSDMPDVATALPPLLIAAGAQDELAAAGPAAGLAASATSPRYRRVGLTSAQLRLIYVALAGAALAVFGCARAQRLARALEVRRRHA
jgi:hypothetical protein